jgi:hypothetical protein
MSKYQVLLGVEFFKRTDREKASHDEANTRF